MLNDAVYEKINDSLITAKRCSNAAHSSDGSRFYEPRGWCCNNGAELLITVPTEFLFCGLEVTGSIDGFYAPSLTMYVWELGPRNRTVDISETYVSIHTQIT